MKPKIFIKTPEDFQTIHVQFFFIEAAGVQRHLTSGVAVLDDCRAGTHTRDTIT